MMVGVVDAFGCWMSELTIPGGENDLVEKRLTKEEDFL